MKKTIQLIVGLLFIPQILLAGPECLVVRGVFDIGSGNTKTKVSVIDHCLQKVQKEIISVSEKVGYKGALTEDKTLPDTIIQTGTEAIKKMKTEAETDATVLDELQKLEQKAIQWRGIATSAFRTAKNGQAAAKSISDEIGVPIKIIEQKTESILGYLAGMTVATSPKAVVWDIGSGSQQITFRNSSGGFTFILLEDSGATPVKNEIIKTVLGKDPKEVTSPNPIGVGNYEASVKVLKEFFPKSKFVDVPRNAEIIGIGGAHQFSIPKATNTTGNYSFEQVKQATQIYLQKNDEAIADKYADTFVTNLLLVETVMDRIHAKNVHVCPYGIADGFMLVQENWKN